MDNPKQFSAQEIISFAKSELGSDIQERDLKLVFDQDGWNKCGELGLTGLHIPSSYGGAGLNISKSVEVLSNLGYGCRDNGLTFAIGAHLWGCVNPLNLFGTDDQKEKYLPDLCSGKLIGALAATETNAGSDIASIETTAKHVNNGYELSGKKVFITNGSIAGVFIVLARLEKAQDNYTLCAFILECNTAGVTVGQNVEKMGLRTTLICELVLNNVFIPKENLLGAESSGMPIFTTTMEWERGLILAPALGIINHQIELCLGYVKSRKQFGDNIGRFQRISDKLVDMQTGLEIGRLLINNFSTKKDLGRIAITESCMTKLHISESWVRSSEHAIQIHGGMGYLTSSGFERDLRDALGSRLYSGTSEIQRKIMGNMMGIE